MTSDSKQAEREHGQNVASPSLSSMISGFDYNLHSGDDEPVQPAVMTLDAMDSGTRMHTTSDSDMEQVPVGQTTLDNAVYSTETDEDLNALPLRSRRGSGFMRKVFGATLRCTAFDHIFNSTTYSTSLRH